MLLSEATTLTEATTKQPGPCQVRSKTEHPCPNRAAVEIYGIPFCKACAREQEAYFAIGELTQEAQEEGSVSEREFAGRVAEAGKYYQRHRAVVRRPPLDASDSRKR